MLTLRFPQAFFPRLPRHAQEVLGLIVRLLIRIGHGKSLSLDQDMKLAGNAAPGHSERAHTRAIGHSLYGSLRWPGAASGDA